MDKKPLVLIGALAGLGLAFALGRKTRSRPTPPPAAPPAGPEDPLDDLTEEEQRRLLSELSDQLDPFGRGA